MNKHIDSGMVLSGAALEQMRSQAWAIHHILVTLQVALPNSQMVAKPAPYLLAHVTELADQVSDSVSDLVEALSDVGSESSSVLSIVRRDTALGAKSTPLVCELIAENIHAKACVLCDAVTTMYAAQADDRTDSDIPVCGLLGHVCDLATALLSGLTIVDSVPGAKAACHD